MHCAGRAQRILARRTLQQVSQGSKAGANQKALLVALHPAPQQGYEQASKPLLPRLLRPAAVSEAMLRVVGWVMRCHPCRWRMAAGRPGGRHEQLRCTGRRPPACAASVWASTRRRCAPWQLS